MHTALVCLVSDTVIASGNISELWVIYTSESKRRNEMMQKYMPSHGDLTFVLLLQTWLLLCSDKENSSKQCMIRFQKKPCNSHLRCKKISKLLYSI